MIYPALLQICFSSSSQVYAIVTELNIGGCKSKITEPLRIIIMYLGTRPAALNNQVMQLLMTKGVSSYTRKTTPT